MAAVHAPPDVHDGEQQRERAGPRRRRGRRLRDRFSAGHWLIVLAGTLAATLNLALLRGADEQQTIVVAASAIVPGQVLAESDLRVSQVEADDVLLARFVAGDDLGGLVGVVATTRIAAGDPLPRSAFVTTGHAGPARTMSLPLDPAHAVGGGLRAGDRVDVITVVDGQARYIAEDLEVVGVAEREGGGALGAHLGGYHVVVAVEPLVALRLAAALHGGGLEVIRSTGAPGLAETGIEVRDTYPDDEEPGAPPDGTTSVSDGPDPGPEGGDEDSDVLEGGDQ